MRLTTKGRFAVTATIDLALRSGDGPVTLAGITVAFGLGAQFLLVLSGIAADGLYDTTQYVQAVLTP